MVWHMVLGPSMLSGRCHLGLWPFVCNQGLRTLYHTNAQALPVQNTATTVEGTAGK